MTTSVNEPTPRFRSPPYPSVDLSKAIERSRQLYAKALHHPASLLVAAEAWAYSPKSSAVAQVIGALIQFDLVSDEGAGDSRRIRLTERALRIIKDPDPRSPKRKEAILGAAINPKIHKELWDRFSAANGLGDTLLLTYLTLERSESGGAVFSEAAASDLIKEYRQTIAFAGLSESELTDPEVAASMPPPYEFDREPASDGVFPAASISMLPQTSPGCRQDIFDLAEGKVVLTWPDRLSESSIQDIEDWFALVLRKAKRSVIVGD